MLTVYTPEQPLTNLSEIYTRVSSGFGATYTPAVCLSDTGFALKSSWCREMVTHNLRKLFTDVPPGTLNIYGIRKHGGGGIPYQPRCPGKIGQTTGYTENLFKSFTTLMVELISCVLDNNTMSSVRVKEWLRRWGRIGFGKSYLVGGTPVGPTVKFLLNSDLDDIPELHSNDFWAEGDMHGTITGIPSHWATSVPIMSYLLYLPRVWGAFYSSPRILPKLSQMSRRKMPRSPVLQSIIGKKTYNPDSYPMSLWTYVAYKMILPLWCTSCGQEYFWTFTHLLMKAAIGKSHGGEIPELVSRLYTSNMSSGFRSWIDWYKLKDDSPKWVRAMLSELAISGPSSLVDFKSITNYV